MNIKKKSALILGTVMLGTGIVFFHLRGNSSGEHLPEKTEPKTEAFTPMLRRIADALPAKRAPAALDEKARAFSVAGAAMGGSFLSRPAQRLVSQERFEGAQVVSSDETPVDRDGHFTRIRVLETSMKYPLVRVEEKYSHDFATGVERLVGRQEMVGDHVILKLEAGYTAEDLLRLTASLGFEIRRTIPGTRLFLVSFSGSDPHALERAVDQLRGAPGVRYSEPDYIVHAN